MTALYQGRALRAEAARGSPSRTRLPRILRMLGVLTLLALLTQLPWRAMGRHWLVLQRVHVDGLHYLEADHVLKVAGLAPGQELLRVDLARARQALRLEPRIADVRIEHEWLRGLAVHVQERSPVLLVEHGVPWEIDSAGVLLPPLADGVEADVPFVVGPTLDRCPAGSRVRTTEVERALAWVRALSDRDLQLGAQLSEVDVSDARSTGLTLLTGTHVLSTAWPPDRRTLSALRVVLADLKQRGTLAQEVDMRFESQIIVRPVPSAPAGASGARRS